MSVKNSKRGKEVRRIHRAVKKEQFAQIHGDFDHLVRLDNGKHIQALVLDGIEAAIAFEALKDAEEAEDDEV